MDKERTDDWNEDTPYMEWTTDLSVGIEIFDEEHKKLIALLNDMHHAMKQGKGKSVLRDVLGRLADYTDYHFTNEEKYFDKLEYPHTDQHKKEHHNLMVRVRGLQKKLEDDAFLLSIEVLEFLKNWVTGHIKGSDFKYTSFFKERGL